MPTFRWVLAGVGLALLMAVPLYALPPDASVPADLPDATVRQAVDASVVDDTLVANAPDAAPLVQPPLVPPAPIVPAVAPPHDDTNVVQYVITARLDAHRHEVVADGTVHWQNTSTVTVGDLWLHLYLNGFKDDDALFMRTTGGEHRGNDHGRAGRLELRTLETAAHEDLLAHHTYDPAVPGDTSQMHVVLPHPVAPGETLDLHMAWTAVLPEVFARTGFHDRFHMVAQWFPKIAVLEADGRWAHFAFHGNTEFYADFGTYDVTMTIPRGWVLGATGQPTGAVEHTAEGDRWHYTASRVHDFAWTTWDAFRERHAVIDNVDVRVLFPPGEETSADRTIATLSGGMPFYAGRFGSYPYPNLTVMIPPHDADGAGGMEYPTLITTEGAWFFPAGFRAVEYVTLHEYAHQYFYGLLASNENAWPFLDEGFAEYATCLSMEGLYGRGESVIDVLGARLDCFSWEAFGSSTISQPGPVARAADAFPSFDDYARHVYSRTTTILRTAEGLYGRGRVRDALGLYTARARFHHPVPDDLFQAFRDSGHDDLVDRLLIPAFTQPESLDYAVTEVDSHRLANGTWRGRVLIRRRGSLELPVDIVLERTDGVRTQVRWEGHGNSFEVPYEGPVALRSARVDPEGRISLDEDRTNNALLAEPGPVVGGVTARFAYWIELALGLVGP